jgi:hypothetical protein
MCGSARPPNAQAQLRRNLVKCRGAAEAYTSSAVCCNATLDRMRVDGSPGG